MPDIVNVGIAVVDAIGRTIDQVPAPKELLMFDRLVVTTGGCAVNCAVDLARMGIENSLIVKVGRDMLGDFIVRETQDQGVNVSRIVRDDTANTSFSFAMVDSTGERRFVHTMGANATFVAQDIDLDFIATHKYCYIGGAMLMPSLDGEPTAKVLHELRKRGVVTLLDDVYVQASRDQWRKMILPTLPELDYFVPSEPEAMMISGLTDPQAMATYFQDHGASNVVIKLGEKGVYYQRKNGENGHVKAYNVSKVVDTTGAGDSWDAGFLAGLNLGYDFPDACRLGNATATFCIQSAGASTGIPLLETILDFQKKNKA
ncbi:MAG: carbohydrate kinase family protein [Phycisphaerae bacterium]|jgi:sugar/nucleoside kinase (ribokinase family)|nr:carbohydrate kinase family protein [Phycisphaerae bacterium]